MVEETRQNLHSIVNGQLRLIGINFRSQFDVAMPQQFHRKALGDPVSLKKRRPRVT
jgi:hypothetical protein